MCLPSNRHFYLPIFLSISTCPERKEKRKEGKKNSARITPEKEREKKTYKHNPDIQRIPPSLLEIRAASCQSRHGAGEWRTDRLRKWDDLDAGRQARTATASVEPPASYCWETTTDKTGQSCGTSNAYVTPSYLCLLFSNVSFFLLSFYCLFFFTFFFFFVFLSSMRWVGVDGSGGGNVRPRCYRNPSWHFGFVLVDQDLNFFFIFLSLSFFFCFCFIV